MLISPLDCHLTVFTYHGCISYLYVQRPIIIYGETILLGIQVTSPACAGATITRYRYVNKKNYHIQFLVKYRRMQKLQIDGIRVFIQHKLHHKTCARASNIQPIYPIISVISVNDMPITDITDYLWMVYRLNRLFACK